jgi:hypothetical protein
MIRDVALTSRSFVIVIRVNRFRGRRVGVEREGVGEDGGPWKEVEGRRHLSEDLEA